MSEPCQVCMALGTNGIDVPCSVCGRPDPTPLELARQSVALGGADVNECDVNALARAVLTQAGELAKLRSALREALGYAEQRDVMAEPGGWKRVDEYEARIVELRRLADGE